MAGSAAHPLAVAHSNAALPGSGRSAEYVALAMKNAGHPGAFPVYVTVISAVGVVAMLFLHDSRHHSTIDNAEGSAYAKRRGGER